MRETRMVLRAIDSLFSGGKWYIFREMNVDYLVALSLGTCVWWAKNRDK